MPHTLDRIYFYPLKVHCLKNKFIGVPYVILFVKSGNLSIFHTKGMDLPSPGSEAFSSVQFSSVHSFSRVRLFVTP